MNSKKFLIWFGALLLVTGGCARGDILKGAERNGDMVFIPAGWFVMGSSADPATLGFEVSADELPAHRVFSKAFWIDRYEVTEEQYYQYLQKTGSKKYPGYWPEAGRADRYPSGYGNYPVSDVDWYDAKEYCAWIGKRLPTEIEWEKAARGPEGRKWPWGDAFAKGNANTRETSEMWAAPPGQKPGIGWKAPVGSHPDDVSVYGVFDMAGNVQEWTASTYTSYPGNKVRRVEEGEGERFRVLRGGSYLASSAFSRAPYRLAVLPTIGPSEDDGWHSDYTYGIRCAKDS